MRFEIKSNKDLKHLVPWLIEHIGKGNLRPVPTADIPGYTMDTDDSDEYTWFFEKIKKISTAGNLCEEIYHVPTITVKDPKQALLFALRWS